MRFLNKITVEQLRVSTLSAIAALSPFIWTLPAHADTFASVSAGNGFTCATTVGGGVRCWGLNNHGQLGSGSSPTVPEYSDSSLPVAVRSITNATAVSAGREHACALVGGGVRCWGSNSNGQLGNGVTGTESTTPVSVTGIGTRRVAASAIAAGDQHTCAIAYDPFNTIAPSYVKCWGNNADGRLGNGTTGGDYSTPVNVPGTYGAMSIAAGERHTCAVLNTGGVRCWGYNGTGQLGDGTTTTRSSPVVVSGITDATQVTAGLNHSCARSSANSGRAHCWGSNAVGQLGDIDPPPTMKLTPSPVVLFLATQQVSAGSSFTCGFAAAGLQADVYCWGMNNYGQLGSNSQRPYWYLPEKIALSTTLPVLQNDTRVSNGADHACAIAGIGAAKQVFCWGSNSYGQLGNGQSGGNAVPGLVEPAPCSMDIDADGQISIDTDWQIMARARLGLKGDALTSGLLGANAVRKTWPDIRSYLETSCGMTGLTP